MSARTPTPWTVQGGTVINAAKSRPHPKGGFSLWIADTRLGNVGTTTAEDKANAAHIVRCVNAHDALVAALRAVYDEATDPRKNGPDIPTLIRAKAALDAAEAS